MHNVIFAAALALVALFTAAPASAGGMQYETTCVIIRGGYVSNECPTAATPAHKPAKQQVGWTEVTLRLSEENYRVLVAWARDQGYENPGRDCFWTASVYGSNGQRLYETPRITGQEGKVKVPKGQTLEINMDRLLPNYPGAHKQTFGPY